jgi:hypothetical protein
MVRTILVVGVMLGLVSVASAGFLSTDPAAMLKGSQGFSSGTLAANVDYAVYAPGQYPDDGLTGNDPSNGAEYVYAYQVFNTGASPITFLSVGHQGPGAAVHNATPDALHATVGGIAPTLWVALSTSVVGAFNSVQIQPPQHSEVLLFTSPNAPTFRAASVANSGQSNQQTLPTPVVPEPAGLALATLALGALLRRSR